MSDPTFTAGDYLRADSLLEVMANNLALQYAIEGESYDRAAMQKHVNRRGALILVRAMLIDEAERISKADQ